MTIFVLRQAVTECDRKVQQRNNLTHFSCAHRLISTAPAPPHPVRRQDLDTAFTFHLPCLMQAPSLLIPFLLSSSFILASL